ncbi:MAG: hypothetical protein DMF29_02445 [Verrucomicrobia bacterium]|nr:MAG: hypothetical protein DMF29_02445 [Verrucomicrobiota bacterium]
MFDRSNFFGHVKLLQTLLTSRVVCRRRHINEENSEFQIFLGHSEQSEESLKRSLITLLQFA